MPVAFVQEFAIRDDDRSTTNYDAITAQLNVQQDWPEGCIFHTAGFDEESGVFRIFEVWETREHSEQFMRERVMPLVEQLGGGDAAPPPDREARYDLHGFVAR
jgi:hypothetical protein